MPRLYGCDIAYFCPRGHDLADFVRNIDPFQLLGHFPAHLSSFQVLYLLSNHSGRLLNIPGSSLIRGFSSLREKLSPALLPQPHYFASPLFYCPLSAVSSLDLALSVRSSLAGVSSRGFVSLRKGGKRWRSLHLDCSLLFARERVAQPSHPGSDLADDAARSLVFSSHEREPFFLLLSKNPP